MRENDIIITYGSDASAMTRALLDAIDIEHLITDTKATIVLKPNLVVAVTPEGGATTHPEIVIAIIEHLKGRGYRNITIAESAWIGDSTERGFAVNRYHEISERYDVPLIDVKKDRYVTKSAGGITMEVSKTVLECDFLINLPVLKGHCQTAMTCALKNMKGCISDRSKRQFHTQGLHRPIASLNRVRSADLIIVDSICGDLDFEEGGNPVETNRLYAARDSVLSDAFGASLIGFASEDIPYIHLAEELGVGSSDLSRMNLISLNEPIEQPLATPTGRAGSLSRHIEERSACSACYGTLIHALKRLDEVGRLKNLKHTISIGQGFKGVEDPKKVGVGSCTQGLGKSLPGCPPKAVDMAEFIKGLEQPPRHHS